MKKHMFVAAVLLTAGFVVQANEIIKFDPAMAAANSVVTDGVKWIDGKYLPIEGRMFKNVDH